MVGLWLSPYQAIGRSDHVSIHYALYVRLPGLDNVHVPEHFRLIHASLHVVIRNVVV